MMIPRHHKPAFRILRKTGEAVPPTIGKGWEWTKLSSY
jgi:hypothetical protein